MPPWILGCRVFTRPPRISGLWVYSETLRAGTFAASSAARVPPVESSSKPSRTRPCAKGTNPRLSETLRRASKVASRGRRVKGPRVATALRACQRRPTGRAHGPPRLVIVVVSIRSFTRRRRGRLGFCGLAQLHQPARLHLPDALAGEVHDRPHLLERDP